MTKYLALIVPIILCAPHPAQAEESRFWSGVKGFFDDLEHHFPQHLIKKDKAPEIPTYIVNHEHAHRVSIPARGFETASLAKLKKSEIIHRLQVADERHAAAIFVGPRFYDLAHSQQRSVIRNVAGGETVILRDWLTREAVGTYSPAQGTMLY